MDPWENWKGNKIFLGSNENEAINFQNLGNTMKTVMNTKDTSKGLRKKNSKLTSVSIEK